MSNKVVYDVDKNMFTIKGKSFFGISWDNKYIYEKDISINENNRLKELADETILTNNDMDLLFKFAQRKYKYNGDMVRFTNTALKDIFYDVDINKVSINYLMPKAYNYVVKQIDFPEVVGETREAFGDSNWLWIMVILFILFILSLYIFGGFMG